MKLVNLTCPNCTARMRPVSQKVPYVKCEYCDSLFKLEGEQLLSTEPDMDTTVYEKKTERKPYVQEKDPVIKSAPEIVIANHRDETSGQRKRMIWSAVIGFLALGLYEESMADIFLLVLVAACVVFFSALKKIREDEYLDRRRRYMQSGLSVSSKEKGIAFICCLFGGWLGAHCFYTGKVGKGLLYFLTFGLFGIGWMIDLIRILFGFYRDRRGNILL